MEDCTRGHGGMRESIVDTGDLCEPRDTSESEASNADADNATVSARLNECHLERFRLSPFNPDNR